jgi:predicted dehydrogenase
MKPLRVGMVGAGFIASRHIQNLMSFSDVEVVGIADVDIGRARDLAQRCAAFACSDHVELLERQPLDALYVCVPPFAHGGVERDALASDLPLFVEKPLALDLGTAEEIAAEVSRRGVVTATGYHWRYLDIVERAGEQLATRPAHLVIGYWLDQMPPVAWWSRHGRSGGQMIEQTTHIFDLLRLLVGGVTSVSAQVAHLGETHEGECDIATVSTASLQFATGAIGTVVSTCLLPRAHQIGLQAFCDGMLVELSEQQLVVDTGTERHAYQALNDPFVDEDRDFVDAVRGGCNRIRAPYTEALATHQLAVAATRAAHEGAHVLITAETE